MASPSSPNPEIVSLSPGERRFRVGVRLPEWATGFIFRVFEGLIEFQRSKVRFELHFDQPSGGDLPPAPIDKNWKGDGLLVMRYTAEEAAAWRKQGISVVNLSTEFPGKIPAFPRVTMNNQHIGRLGAEHLRSLGLREFAYIHESSRRYSAERLEGFRKAVIEAGGRCHVIEVPASTYPSRSRPKHIDKCMLQPLEKLPRPCGIFTKDDIAAVWTLRCLKQLGISCPDEMPILGVSDDIVFCHMMDPPISSIPYSGERIGFQSATLLHRMMSGESIPNDHRIEVSPRSVIHRESTRRVMLTDAVVTRALNFLRGQIEHRSIQVEELAREAGVSRELLRQRFQAVLGCSPKEQIERLRCFHVCDLLRTTNLTLESLAYECGFSGSDEVCRFIKRMTGKTPGSIRRERRHGGEGEHAVHRHVARQPVDGLGAGPLPFRHLSVRARPGFHANARVHCRLARCRPGP